MTIKLVQPSNAPNFCFAVMAQRLYKLKREVDEDDEDYDPSQGDFSYGKDLKRPQWPKEDDPDYESLMEFYQNDFDYPPVARRFGWDMSDVNPEKKCDHRGTDGSITCPDCGTPALVFITAAGKFLHANVGKIVKE